MHAAWNWKGIQGCLDNRRQQLGRRGARLGPDEKQERPFALVQLLQRVHSNAATLRERRRSSRRLTRRIERSTGRRPSPLDVLVGLARNQFLDPDGQSTRRGIRNQASVSQSSLLQPRL